MPISARKWPLLQVSTAAIVFAMVLVAPTAAQQSTTPPVRIDPSNLLNAMSDFRLDPAGAMPRNLSAATFLRGTSFTRVRPLLDSPFLARPSVNLSPSTIDRMEAAFYCNDTPFIDQVRLPLATLWGGRLKFTGFESDITTANFVMGLPGGGALKSLSLTGSGYLVIRTPPSDQVVGMHMTFNFRGGDADAFDNSGLRGLQYVVRASRGLLQSIGSR